jgi:acyl carrier protein
MWQLRYLRQASGPRRLRNDFKQKHALATERVFVFRMSAGGEMRSATEAVIHAVGHVMNMPVDALDATTPFGSIGADSVALIVIADVIEENNAYLVPNDVLKAAHTVADLAAGLESR